MPDKPDATPPTPKTVEGEPPSGRTPVAVSRDAWIAKVQDDPAKTTDALCLFGYVGDSTDKQAIRLYADAHLVHCIDVPLDAIVYSESIPRAVSPLGGSYLWVSKSHWHRCKWYRRSH